MAKSPQPSLVQHLRLPEAIRPEIEAWREDAYPGVTETTAALLQHWFTRDEFEVQFHDCQRHAIETAIYLHEVVGIETLQELYQKYAPEQLKVSAAVAKEVGSIPFAKYCFKMATGSGKTWVLAALVVWQYFNTINDETPVKPSGPGFCGRFLVVAPGRDVLDRLFDSFKGKRDPRTGSRDPSKSDYALSLFMPNGQDWRDRFHLLQSVLGPDDMRANASPPDAPFVALTNWQQFARPKDPSLAEQVGLETPQEAKRDIIADFLAEQPGLIVFNDEAHHVHGNRSAKAEELVWREFMTLLHQRMQEYHGEDAGLFMQCDFSATPFFGSGGSREYFPHIIYDYDLRDAINAMLVKQLFLEQRHGDHLADLDFRAERDPDTREVLALSEGQKQILNIGFTKLNQLAAEFKNAGLKQKPVLLVLGEDTTVAGLVSDYFQTLTTPDHQPVEADQVLNYWTNLDKKRFGYDEDEARSRLDDIDRPNKPVRIVNSVLKLREGFDKNNICVVCMLRASEADLLLEQVVGRGLRLMFPRHKATDALWQMKVDTFEALQQKQQAPNSLDCLFIVEHPRFSTFYDELKAKGYLIAVGSSEQTPSAGNLETVLVDPARVPKHDIAWPVATTEEPALPDIDGIDPDDVPLPTQNLRARQHTLGKTAVVDTHLETSTVSKPWCLTLDHFNYDDYLIAVTRQVTQAGKTPQLTGQSVAVMGLVDELTENRLFGQRIDTADDATIRVLADPNLQSVVIKALRGYLGHLMDALPGPRLVSSWAQLSDLPSIEINAERCIETVKCIYPRVGFRRGEGFEAKVMQWLDKDASVLAWCKLQTRHFTDHGMTIYYRDPAGIQRSYHPDFLVRTADRVFVIETKADDQLTHPIVVLKARAAVDNSTGTHDAPPSATGLDDQPTEWEYLMLSESLYAKNANTGLTPALPAMRQLTVDVAGPTHASADGQGSLL